MAQVNNNAESLSRELRKFKNLKSVDFKGLLSGTPESFVNLYRYLFCESNIGFSQLVLDKGYDMSGLNDYKFMEAIYRMMRDFLNIKPPINQNQFFAPGFTQRKLEMSTLLASEVRKMTNDILSNKNVKKSVQTTALMKSSLKRPNSAPKQTRVIELGDESDTVKTEVPFEKYKKTKATNKYAEKNKTSDKRKARVDYSDHSISSDELSEDSIKADSYMSQSMATKYQTGHNYDIRPRPIVERADTTAMSSQSQVTRNNYDGRSVPLMDSQKYSAQFNYQKPTELNDMSAFETVVNGHDRPYSSIKSRNNNQERMMYDVKHYVPSSLHNDSVVTDKEQSLPALEKIMTQFDTVLARLTLLEGRMQRIESKVDNAGTNVSDRQTTSSLYENQGNINNAEYISSFEHNHVRTNPYSNKNNAVTKVTKDAIPDFESNHQPPLRSKTDSERSYTSSTYSTNYKPLTVSDNNYPGPRYVTNYTNYVEKRAPDLPGSSGARNEYCAPQLAPHNTVQSPQASSASQQQPHHQGSHTFKAPQSGPKSANGIPPLYPTTKKPDDLVGYRDNRYRKLTDENGLSQTDRIASMLSDTQKMLRLSDEEL